MKEKQRGRKLFEGPRSIHRLKRERSSAFPNIHMINVEHERSTHKSTEILCIHLRVSHDFARGSLTVESVSARDVRLRVKAKSHIEIGITGKVVRLKHCGGKWIRKGQRIIIFANVHDETQRESRSLFSMITNSS